MYYFIMIIKHFYIPQRVSVNPNIFFIFSCRVGSRTGTLPVDFLWEERRKGLWKTLKFWLEQQYEQWCHLLRWKKKVTVKVWEAKLRIKKFYFGHTKFGMKWGRWDAQVSSEMVKVLIKWSEKSELETLYLDVSYSKPQEGWADKARWRKELWWLELRSTPQHFQIMRRNQQRRYWLREENSGIMVAEWSTVWSAAKKEKS